jgi:signal peptide peptidase SppA
MTTSLVTIEAPQGRGGRAYSELFNRPLAIERTKLELMTDIVWNRVTTGGGGTPESLEEEMATKAMRREGTPWPHGSRVGQVTGGQSYIVDGVAIVQIHGIIQARGSTGFDGWASEMFTSTIERRRELEACLSDPSVRAILLDIDSPGGTAAGTFELADFIYESRGAKPIWAHCNGLAASAAYALACSADKVLVTRTSECGHVGTYLAVMEYTEALEKAGIKPHVIASTELKVAGHPLVEQTDARLAELARIVLSLNAQFLATVARGRGMEVAEVEETGARLYVGSQAVKIGFADEVMGFEAALAALADTDTQPGGAFATAQTPEPSEGADAARATADGDTDMALLKKKKPGAAAPKNGPKGMDGDDDEEDEAARAEGDPMPDDDEEEGAEDDDEASPEAARKAERARIREINSLARALGHDPDGEAVTKLIDSGASLAVATRELVASKPKRRAEAGVGAMAKGVPALVGQTVVTNDAGGDGAGNASGEPATYADAMALVGEEAQQRGQALTEGQAAKLVNRRWPKLARRTQEAAKRSAPSQ